MLKWQMEVSETNPDIHTSSTSSDTLLSRLRLSLLLCATRDLARGKRGQCNWS